MGIAGNTRGLRDFKKNLPRSKETDILRDILLQ